MLAIAGRNLQSCSPETSSCRWLVRQVNGPRSLQGIVEQLDVDKPYDVNLLRDGKRQTLKIGAEADAGRLLAAVPTSKVAEKTSRSRMTLSRSNRYGFDVQELTPKSPSNLVSLIGRVVVGFGR